MSGGHSQGAHLLCTVPRKLNASLVTGCVAPSIEATVYVVKKSLQQLNTIAGLTLSCAAGLGGTPTATGATQGASKLGSLSLKTNFLQDKCPSELQTLGPCHTNAVEARDGILCS